MNTNCDTMPLCPVRIDGDKVLWSGIDTDSIGHMDRKTVFAGHMGRGGVYRGLISRSPRPFPIPLFSSFIYTNSLNPASYLKLERTLSV